MASVTNICNLGLGRIAQTAIDSFDDDQSAEAIHCRNLYDVTRDYVLADFPWGITLDVQALTKESVNPLSDVWAYRYQMPTCLRLWAIWPKSGRPPKGKRILGKRMGQSLYTNEPDARVVIGVRIDDPTQYSPALVSCIGWRMGRELIMPLTADVAFMDKTNAGYEDEKNKAWAVDGDLFDEAIRDQLDADPDYLSDRN